MLQRRKILDILHCSIYIPLQTQKRGMVRGCETNG